MQPVEIVKNVYWVGVNDRQSELFEGLWPIKQSGVSLNSYLIKDEKTVLIDLSNDMLSDSYVEMLQSLVDLSKIDFIVLNHLEPDHTGALLTLVREAPNAVFLGTAKAAEIVGNFYDIRQNFRVVADGETLSIGKRTLKFVAIPFVHWPETMVTYLVEDQILFSCDAFGGYGALQGILFDDQCTNLAMMEKEALRYYANIVSAHSTHTRRAIAKLAGTPIKIVAPSHGLLWRKDPQRIIELYSKWANYSEGGREKAVTVMFGSMYGNTRDYAESIMQAISEQHLPVESFDINTTHVSYILPSLWKNQGVIVCAPTYETSMFPIMLNVLNMAKIKRIQNRTAAYFGSYGWGSMAKKQFESYCTEQKWDMIENSQFYGKPKAADFEIIKPFAEKFVEAVKKAS
ncbi:MAG: FprA family A-type flavoprotein [Chloroflexi bacterium]|nr:FprA family A-type flavoprotein [Chloroflexota bacterium]